MDIQRLCDNRTPMAVHCVPMDDRHGREVLVVIARMTFGVSAEGVVSIARPPSPVRLVDERTSDTAHASLRFPGDLVEEKPGTDVLLVGTAYPSEPEMTRQRVSLWVEAAHGRVQKTLDVYGPRVWQAGLFGLTPGPAARLSPTPLIYELAYGGVDTTDPVRAVFEPRNPWGTGFHERRLGLAGRPAPVIEDPRAPLGSAHPAPAGFGPIAPHVSPRSERKGTHDDTWRRERAPLRPLDFDPRHNCAAPPDQWLEVPLGGDEPVEVLGATPGGVWRFRLPRYGPVFRATVRGQESLCETHLDTYLIDADRHRVELTFRTRIPLPRKTEHLERVLITGSTRLPHAMLAELAARTFGHSASVKGTP
jgi:hypothetical protein